MVSVPSHIRTWRPWTIQLIVLFSLCVISSSRAITVFSPTTFTKAGVDIYYRSPVMPAEKLAEVQAIIDADPYLKERATGMFATVQDPRGRDRPGSTEYVGKK
jgi:hypothetical protein